LANILDTLIFAIARQDVPIAEPFQCRADSGLKLTPRPVVGIASGLARVGESHSEVPAVLIRKERHNDIPQRAEMSIKRADFLANRRPPKFTVGARSGNLSAKENLVQLL
jgi:hypothetical protein